MRFNQRLLIAFVAPAVLFAAALAASIGSLVQTQREFDDYFATEQAIANDVREMYAQSLKDQASRRTQVVRRLRIPAGLVS